ncbi:MAG: cupin domain-containing protein, partial [Thermomicrobiales bacterium]|nr:cupin domain-containing protein [Thermomicrobiales bacterium]
DELPATFIKTVAGADFMGCGILPQAPGQTLYLARFVLQPGQTLERHWHPGWGLIGYVESGVGSLRVLEGVVWMVRATPEGGTPPAPELVPQGVEIIAHPGDWVFYGENTVIVEGVAGDEPVSTLIAGLAVTGQGPIDFLPAEPVVAEALADGVPADTPGKIMRLARFTLPPGSSVASHIHPGSELAYIQEGRIAMKMFSGEAVIRRAGSTTEEPFLPGDEVILEAGDVMFAEEPMVHDLRNAGNDTAVILVTVLLDETQEPVQFVAEDSAATPVATPEASPTP